MQNLKAAIKEGREITVRLLNYRKDGTPFWNMLTVAPIRDVTGNPRFLVGVQVDVTAQPTVEAAAPVGHSAATAVGAAMRTVDWVGMDPWTGFPSGLAVQKPHHAGDPAEAALREAVKKEGKLRLRLFQRLRQLGSGDVGMVDLVSLGTAGPRFALKSLAKDEMIERNKVGRVKTEQRILASIDHPFLAHSYAQLQTDTHLHFILEYCSGGELYALLNAQPGKRLPESAVKFYACEVLLALQYLHLQGFMYRDLKPENILLHASGHIKLTDFDLSYSQGHTTPKVITTSTAAPALPPSPGSPMAATPTNGPAIAPGTPPQRNATSPHANGAPSRKSAIIRSQKMMLVATPEGRANSFVGTEEYLAPEVIQGNGHDAMVDWWSFGILLYELLYGTTPFRGSRRDATFNNVLKRALSFPATPEVSPEVKDLITKLLTKDAKERLGAVAGAEEIKQHPWFDGINWALVRNQTPPYIPGRRSSIGNAEVGPTGAAAEPSVKAASLPAGGPKAEGGEGGPARASAPPGHIEGF